MSNKTYAYDPDLPYVVEGAVSEALYARFTGRDLAEKYVENTGGLLRVIDTNPAPRVPEDAEFDLIPLYRHPSAPIEVTDEALVTVMNVLHGYETPVTDIAYWSESYRENIRAGITAAFKEMNR